MLIVLLIAALCAACAGIGWAARGLWDDRNDPDPPATQPHGGYPAGQVSRVVMPKAPAGPAPGAIPKDDRRA